MFAFRTASNNKLKAEAPEVLESVGNAKPGSLKTCLTSSSLIKISDTVTCRHNKKIYLSHYLNGLLQTRSIHCDQVEHQSMMDLGRMTQRLGLFLVLPE